MRICAISDMHGNYNFDIEPCDIIFICGDITPLNIQHDVAQSLKWFKSQFVPFFTSLPCDRVFLVAGNHDFFMEKSSFTIKDIVQDTKITYLFNENYTYLDKDMNAWTLFGTPLCHKFGHWAFMYSDEYNYNYYKLMNDNVDFVLTHDMPYSMNDELLQDLPWLSQGHLGNVPLYKVIQDKKPKYVFGGHLHSCDHNVIDYNGTKCANVSLLDEEYNLVYKPLYLTITQNAD